MGNGNCKRCKCNNCVNEEKNLAENIFDKNLDIIKNDPYESFDNEFKKNKIQLNDENENKMIQIPKNEIEKNTTNNNLDNNITDNKKEKLEIENSNSINNIDKTETINNIINYNDKTNKEEVKGNYISKKDNNEEDLINITNNIHIANFKNENDGMNEIKGVILKKGEDNKLKGKVNNSRNNYNKFDIINSNDLGYITNKNKIMSDNLESNNFSKENKNNLNNDEYDVNKNDKYDENYKDIGDNDNDAYKKSNNITKKNSNNLFKINKIINIYSIIPKNKLLKLNDNSILCNSILEKIIKIPEKKKIVYNERFCVLTKKNFTYYKSKESYLNLAKPLLLIDLKHIIKVEQTILDDTSYYFGLICMINEETKKYVDKINTFINAGENNDEEFLLGFRSKDKDLIIKWIVILNYFVENYEYNYHI